MTPLTPFPLVKSANWVVEMIELDPGEITQPSYPASTSRWDPPLSRKSGTHRRPCRCASMKLWEDPSPYPPLLLSILILLQRHGRLSMKSWPTWRWPLSCIPPWSRMLHPSQYCPSPLYFHSLCNQYLPPALVPCVPLIATT